MRNIFKYPPIEWRKRNEYVAPQGPLYSWATSTNISIAGSRLGIKAPSHSPRRAAAKPVSAYPGYDVIFDSPAGLHTDLTIPGGRWGVACVWSRRWAFYGPWMTGCKGELVTAIAVIGRSDEHRNSNISFLSPNAFEMILMQYLNDCYGAENWEGERSNVPRFHGPVGWKRHTHLPVPSASFNICSRGEDVGCLHVRDHLFAFPVSDQYFVLVTATQHHYSRDESGDLAFDVTPMQDLQDQVLQSISLELGPEAKASVDKIKAELGSLYMSKDFAPLKWPTNIYPPEAGNVPEAKQPLRNNA